jgi:hypothetical protein
MHAPNSGAEHPALDQFDTHSGSRLERLVFNNRRAVMIVCLVLTACSARWPRSSSRSTRASRR